MMIRINLRCLLLISKRQRLYLGYFPFSSYLKDVQNIIVLKEGRMLKYVPQLPKSAFADTEQKIH